jgi:carbamoyl-phosphate synthase large subunit
MCPFWEPRRLMIDNAEDREKFSSLLDRLKIDQPRWANFQPSKKYTNLLTKLVSRYLIRPSYVLSGAAMNVVSNPDQLEHFLEMATKRFKGTPGGCERVY